MMFDKYKCDFLNINGSKSFQVLIIYYCQEKYSNHVLKVSSESQRKFSSSPIYTFFHAYGLLMQGKVNRTASGTD